jgi:O-antigen ligase
MAGNLSEGPSSSAGVWILRLCTLSTVAFSAMVVASAILSKRPAPKESRALFVAFCVYYFCAYVINGVFGSVPDVSYKTLYPILIVSGIYIASNYSSETVLRVTRDGMLAFLVVGLLILPFKMDLVAQRGYSGLVPGLSFRYWGLASHANNIGPLALFFALITLLHPYRTKMLNCFAALIVGVTLVLAQSKTALGATLIVAAVLILYISFRAIFRNAYGFIGSAITLSVAMLISTVFLLSIIGDFYHHFFDVILAKIQGRDTLLTGREFIWQITMNEWRASPIFGYGPGLWGTEFSARNGYFGIASNAHNQAVDTLGAAGIVGLSALTVYVTTLGYYAFKLAHRTHWVSIYIFLFVLIRCVTEVPLKTINVTTSDFFMHCIILAIFMRLLCEQRAEVVEKKASFPMRFTGVAT